MGGIFAMAVTGPPPITKHLPTPLFSIVVEHIFLY